MVLIFFGALIVLTIILVRSVDGCGERAPQCRDGTTMPPVDRNETLLLPTAEAD